MAREMLPNIQSTGEKTGLGLWRWSLARGSHPQHGSENSDPFTRFGEAEMRCSRDLTRHNFSPQRPPRRSDPAKTTAKAHNP